MRVGSRSSLGFLVYGHSRSEDDRTFLSRYRPALLQLGGKERVADEAFVRFGPSMDFYDVGTFREERWVGSLRRTYNFSVDISRSH